MWGYHLEIRAANSQFTLMTVETCLLPRVAGNQVYNFRQETGKSLKNLSGPREEKQEQNPKTLTTVVPR